MLSYNDHMFEIIKELQDLSYEQQEIEEEKYRKNFWKNCKLCEKKVEINVPQYVLRNATIISHLFLLGSKEKIIKILYNKKNSKI